MSKAITKSGLTAKQELFCVKYAKDFNATRAAIDAGYSKRSAHIIGFENLRKPKIQERIKELVEQIFEDEDIQVKHIVKHLITMASFDTSDIYHPNGNLKNIHDMPEHIRRIIQGIKTTRTEDGDGVFTTIEDIKIPNRLKATELLGRYLKMFVEQVEHKGNINLTIRPASQDDGDNGRLLEDE